MMAWTDALSVVEKLAPMLATGLAGPIAGGAVSMLEGVFGLTPAPTATIDARQTSIATAISGATPDQLLALKKADQAYAIQMATLGFKDAETLAQLAQAKIQTYVSDTQDARKYKDDKVFWLGVVILLTFAATMGAAMYGCYSVLTGGITIKDVAVVAAVSGFIGSVVGYVAANAQQVVGYFFGSSAGSESKTNAMADTIKGAFQAKS